jgi:DNA-binding SARP family transcriptional activator
VEFCLLGPLVVRSGDALLPIPHGKQRTLLAAPLVHAGQVIPVDELAELLWEGSPPLSARVTLQNYVKRLRQALGPAGRARLRTHRPGYLIEASADEVDLLRFAALCGAGHAAARQGDWAGAAARLRTALSLWRGQPFGTVPSGRLARAEGPRLEEMRIDALETRIDAEMHLGGHGAVLTELRQLVAAERLRERPRGLLMLALYRAGRPGEALAEYRDAHRALVQELGLEPGPRLRRLYQQIQSADPGLDLAVAAPAPEVPGILRVTSPGPRPVVPRQLPAAVAHFTGRRAELDALTRPLDRTASPDGAVTIWTVAGTAGIGKTALALHWAHRVADRFGDGQLYASLRGFGPRVAPAAPGEVIRGLPGRAGRAAREPARPRGGSGGPVPEPAGRPPHARGARQRAGRRAGAPVAAGQPGLRGRGDQPQPADRPGRRGRRRPAEPRPASRAERGRAAGPSAGTGAAVAGTRRSPRPDQALRAQLPLALAVVAGRAASRPDVPLGRIAAELRAARLDALATGEPATDLRAVLSWSYGGLTPPAAAMFRLFGLRPGPDITAASAASLARMDLRQARAALAELARAHLIEEQAPGRFTLHELLRAHAVERASAESAIPA